MTRNEFAAVCGEHLIDPAVALENERVIKALAQRDDAAIGQILSEEF